MDVLLTLLAFPLTMLGIVWIVAKYPEWKDNFTKVYTEVSEERDRQRKLDEDYKRAVIEINEREKRNRF